MDPLGLSQIPGECPEDDLRPNVPYLSPEMEEKILYGQRKLNANGQETNRIIGGHGANISNLHPDYAVEVLAENSDGTRLVKFIKQFSDGSVSRMKKSTLFPDGWTDDDIISSVKKVASGKPVASRASDGASLYISEIKGVKIELITDRYNKITAAYPSGGSPTNPLTFGD